MKKCNKCNIEKSPSEFSKDKTSIDGLQYKCKECRKIIDKNHFQNNKTYFKNYYQGNSDYYKTYRKENKDKIQELNKQWRKDNPEYDKEYSRKRYSTDIEYKIKCVLRTRIGNAVKDYNLNKKDSSIEELGCSIQDYFVYLEQQFTNEMNWDNHGTYWEIDHIHPLSKGGSFHYTNTQPLTIEENRSKSNKLLT